METIPLTADAVGQRLARDLLDEQGRTILGSGIEITADHVRMLSRRGIEEVMVQAGEVDAGQPDPDEPASAAREEIDNPVLRRRVARVRHMFVDVMDSEHMRRLFRLALDFARKGDARA